MLENALPGMKMLEAYSAVHSIDVPPDNVFDPVFEVLVQLELLVGKKLFVANVAHLLFAHQGLGSGCNVCFCLPKAGTDTDVEAYF